MTYSLKIWTKPGTDDTRLYINGTTRQSVYFKLARDGARVVVGSKAIDTPHKFQTGNHYQKVNKDHDAAREVADAYNLPLGDDSTRADWDRIVKIAEDGIEVA